MSLSSIAIIIGLIIGVCGLVACIIVACTHRSLNPMKISLIVMSAGGCHVDHRPSSGNGSGEPAEVRLALYLARLS